MTKTTETELLAAASVIGVVAGMRAFAAPAIVGQFARRGGLDIERSYLGQIGHPTTANVLAALSIGELIGDKLPIIPRRTKAFPLLARIVSGAFCGAVLCDSANRSSATGALAGALGALGGTFGAYHLRKMATQSLGFPDLAVAVAEDALAIGLGIFVTNSVAERQGAV